jgi:flagellar hook-basal body complex protein FliE
MDGLTVSTSQALLERGQTLKELRDSELRSQLTPPTAGVGETSGKSFADTLKEAVQSVNLQQKESDTKMEQLATGKNDNVADVMISAEKADISLKLMVSVRNKIIEAYQEIMKMQV